MAKRELIDREQVITEIKYMDNNGFITRTVNHVCEDIRMIPAITEQEIVKPYLERLKRRMEARDDDNGGEPLNAVDRGYHLAYEHLCEEIDNLLSESEVKANENEK